METKYSVYDIDRMRHAVKCLVNIGGKADEIARIHEEHLRTYMLNGTTPDELEEDVTRRTGHDPKMWSNYPRPFAALPHS